MFEETFRHKLKKGPWLHVVPVPVSLHIGWIICDMCPWLLSPNSNKLMGHCWKPTWRTVWSGLGNWLQGLVSSPSRLWLFQFPSQPATGRGWVPRYSWNRSLTLWSVLYSELQGQIAFLVWSALSFWILEAGECDWGEAVKRPCKWQVLA